MGTLVKLFRLLGAAYSMSLRRELAFRVNLCFDLLLAVVTIGSALAVVQLVFTQTDELAGWSRAELIVLVGTFQFMSGLKSTFLDPNLAWFPVRGIREGRLDVYLLQPAPSLFLVSFGMAAPLSMLQAGLGLGVVGLGVSQSEQGVSALGVAGWLLFVAIGVAVAWMLGVLVACLGFWAPRLELEVAYGSIWELARYPVQIYRGPLRFVLTYVFPMVLIATTPSHVLLNGIELSTLLASLAAGGFAVLVGSAVWRLGLRRYTGATS
jgi:ABC-2 type transport system permease protein